jgi:3-methylcrotonyl-CoA carboxylase alpha subunit
VKLRSGDRLYAPVVRETASETEVTLAGDTYRLQIHETSPGTFVWESGSRRELFHCLRAGGEIHLFWQGITYVLREEEDGDAPLAAVDPGLLEAPMPGTVISVAVRVGQRVTRGDELVVVEAMKMENALRAPRDGVVRTVLVSVGDSVAPGRTLVELEPEAP